VTAREEILARIHTALGTATADPAAGHASTARTYNRGGTLSPEDRLHLLKDRLLDYDADVLEISSEAEIPTTIAEALARHSEHRALIDPSLPAHWLPDGPTFVADHALTTAQIEGVPAVITTCEAACAATGTLFLVHEGPQARRILTLLPDHHIILLRRDQVHELIPEALRALGTRFTRPITTISGPSATSDIEMTRIRGVHGPRRLTVILFS
jgi:L-lactate dehydrogenase complex protein LldG